MLGIVTVLLASQALLAIGAPSGEPIADGDDLVALCSGKEIDLRTVEQLQSLANKMEATFGQCQEEIKHSLVDLLAVVEVSPNDACTMEKVNKFKEFYNVHLDRSEDAKKKKLPKSLERFALAYGMQLNSHCKLHMMRVLVEDGDKLLTDEDFNLLTSTIQGFRDQRSTHKVMNWFAQTGDMVLPNDVLALFKLDKLPPLRTADSHEFYETERAKEVCSNRFEPIYESVVAPVVALSKYGFDLPGVLLKSQMPDDMKTLYESMDKWTSVVIQCKILSNMKTEFVGTNGLLKSATDKFQALPPVEEVHHEHRPSGDIGNLVVVDDHKLEKAIESFSTSALVSKRARDMLKKKSKQILEEKMKGYLKDSYLGKALSRMGLNKLKHKD